MAHKLRHITDSLLTQNEARNNLPEPVVITWFTNKSNTQSVLHSHPYYELILPLEGDVLYSANGSIYVVHPGELIIFPAEIYHYGKYDLSKPLSERLLAQIDSAIWNKTASALGYFSVCTEHSVFTLNAETVSQFGIKKLFEQLDLCRNFTNENYKMKKTENLLSALLLSFMQASESSESEVVISTHPLVERSISYLQQNYSLPEVNVSKLAEYTYTSREHLSRLFKTYTMQSIHSYLTELRMQHFRKRISEGAGILEACQESGFSNYSSFTRCFKKLHGISPAEYKKKQLGIQQKKTL